ncbi:MAG: ribbon-helix-helix protein, CopG family [archaeon]|nr:ribbon-helix-helix domain-containing protein [Nanoarchaeota archaeon]
MKKKLSVSVDEELISKLDDRLKDRMLRNRSHLVEIALMRYLEE